MLCIIVLAELALMFALNWLHLELPGSTLALINALALALIVSGVLLWAAFSPGRAPGEARDMRKWPGVPPELHPWKTFVLIVAAVFFVDTGMMLLFEIQEGGWLVHGWQEAVSHGVVSTVPVAGVVWWLVVAPLDRAMQILRESETRYRTLFESSWDAILTLEPPEWKFSSANHAALRMFGAKDEAELTALSPWSLSPPLQPDGRLSSEKGAEMVAIAMRDGAHYFDWTHSRLGGGSFPATVLLTRVEQGGHGFLESTVRDITAEVAAREALARANAELAAKNRELDAANRAKAEFLAAVTHELRTPLNVILGFADLLAAGEAGELNTRQIEQVREIRGAGGELLKIVNAILDMSSLDAEKLAAGKEAVDLAAVVRGAVAAQARQAKERGIEIGITIEPDAEFAECNPRAVRKALDQLLSNAVKFNRDNGRVHVMLRRSKGNGKPGPIEIAVADTGIGIASEDMPRLFQPFVQLDASPARRYGGIGIGLALVRRLAEACGGQVRVESEPGRGSVFTLCLPDSGRCKTELEKAAHG